MLQDLEFGRLENEFKNISATAADKILCFRNGDILLSMADWYPRNNLPAQDDGISLTREMIRIFGEGNEPKNGTIGV